MGRNKKNRDTPLLPCVSCDVQALLARVRSDRVPVSFGLIPVYFVEQKPLACVCRGEKHAQIRIHQLLNTPDTPPEVFLYILTHEMLHLVIPARIIEGESIIHTPEFFEQENVLSPERLASWAWIWRNFGSHLISDKVRERISIRKGWERLMHKPRVPMRLCRPDDVKETAL